MNLYGILTSCVLVSVLGFVSPVAANPKAKVIYTFAGKEDAVSYPACRRPIIGDNWYFDLDRDGWGDSSKPAQIKPFPGAVNCKGDHNDLDATVYSGAVELLDGKDNDGNGRIDDTVDVITEQNLAALSLELDREVSAMAAAPLTTTAPAPAADPAPVPVAAPDNTVTLETLRLLGESQQRLEAAHQATETALRRNVELERQLRERPKVIVKRIEVPAPAAPASRPVVNNQNPGAPGPVENNMQTGSMAWPGSGLSCDLSDGGMSSWLQLPPGMAVVPSSLLLQQNSSQNVNAEMLWWLKALVCLLGVMFVVAVLVVAVLFVLLKRKGFLFNPGGGGNNSGRRTLAGSNSTFVSDGLTASQKDNNGPRAEASSMGQPVPVLPHLDSVLPFVTDSQPPVPVVLDSATQAEVIRHLECITAPLAATSDQVARDRQEVHKMFVEVTHARDQVRATMGTVLVNMQDWLERAERSAEIAETAQRAAVIERQHIERQIPSFIKLAGRMRALEVMSRTAQEIIIGFERIPTATLSPTHDETQGRAPGDSAHQEEVGNATDDSTPARRNRNGAEDTEVSSDPPLERQEGDKMVA